MHPLETYLSALYDARLGGGVAETSGYAALANLLNEVGGGLKPKTRCILHPRDQGAGIPDGGLYTVDQFERKSAKVAGAAGGRAAGELKSNQVPSRGVVEVKSTGEDVTKVAASEQVLRYLERYRRVLVTNYRDFVLVGYDATGRPAQLETYSLAPNEAEFWAQALHPRTMARVHGGPLTEYLKRVMLSAAPLAAPEDVAWFLASYARDAKARIEESDLPALTAVREALEEALGIRFEGEKGEHFFRSTLVQTLFYGIFSAWVLWSQDLPPDDRTARFDWKGAAWTLQVPVIRALFEQVATPGKLEPLRLVEVLDWAAAALNRVDRAAFFSRFEETHAVQYFYEPFLEAFDPELRKELGVWYTPPEVVQYMVARVDTVLREELGVADGLADPRVYVLDPCCGTGTYLLEVLERIALTLDEKGGDALNTDDLKRAAMTRVFGFEIMPAPFVIAHLQLGLFLQHAGAPFSEHAGERAAVYLTNALTGWEKPHDHAHRLPFPELEDERDAAEKVKRDLPILVILGNPPYNGYAGVSPEEEEGLVEPYKRGLNERWGITKNYLDDLYVRFFRLAERRIAELTGRGVVCLISSFSFIDDPSFVVMRERFVNEFDRIWIDCLNGDSRETGKTTPDGKPDPSVFSTAHNRQGIRVGTAVTLMARGANRTEGPSNVQFRHFWGTDKRQDLLSSLGDSPAGAGYEVVLPEAANWYSFRPIGMNPEYLFWPSVADLIAQPPGLGLNDNRAQATHAIARSEISDRMRAYYDPALPFESVPLLHHGLATNAASFDAEKTRERLLSESEFREEHILRFWFKPFDLRWAYVETKANLWNRVRPDLIEMATPEAQFLLVRRRIPGANDGAPFLFTRCVADQHVLQTDAYFIPFALSPQRGTGNAPLALFDLTDASEPRVTANLSPEARGYVDALELSGSLSVPDDSVFLHALAVGYAPSYAAENGSVLRQDWPRVPLPDSPERLIASAELGRQIAVLLDTETDVSGVTLGAIRPELRAIGAVSRAGGGALNPDAGDLSVTAGWGHGGKGGITMPGKGRIAERDYSPDELDALHAGAEALGLTLEEALAHLGATTRDIYLNDVAYWRNVPAGVWSYTIGGYQVMKKWLSYRERGLLGRDLSKGEAREVMNMARRIAAILLLEPALDANYLAVTATTWAWDRGPEGGGARDTQPA
ncbi:MAG: N-6 DNA methylase [Actinobacteria bacterium]|nr:N-6 DNA methylase [Actinomycetota bacterium]